MAEAQIAPSRVAARDRAHPEARKGPNRTRFVSRRRCRCSRGSKWPHRLVAGASSTRAGGRRKVSPRLSNRASTFANSFDTEARGPFDKLHPFGLPFAVRTLKQKVLPAHSANEVPSEARIGASVCQMRHRASRLGAVPLGLWRQTERGSHGAVRSGSATTSLGICT